MDNEILKIEGFKELNQKLKRLPDSVTRLEILKIQRRVVKPVVKAYAQTAPKGKKSHSRYIKSTKKKISYEPGNLSRSIAAVTVPARFTGGNPSLVVRPTSKGKVNDGYYRFMVVNKGFTGSGRGSRIGSNTVIQKARDRAIATVGASVQREALAKTAAFIQKRINKLK